MQAPKTAAWHANQVVYISTFQTCVTVVSYQALPAPEELII